jgi:trigger factor
MKAGEERPVEVDFPADFVSQELAGKKGTYEVKLTQVKERILPEVDEEFAKSFGGESLEKMKEGIKNDLESEQKFQENRDVRDQLVKDLMEQAKFDLPETVVATETRNVGKDVIEEQKDQIFSAANANAKEKVKAMYLLSRIAEKEGIKAEQEELAARVQAMAQQYQMPVDKLIKQLKERDGFGEIHEQVLVGKVLDFLQLNANVEEVPAAAA